MKFKNGDLVVYKPMFNIDITYKVVDDNMFNNDTYIKIKNSERYWGERMAHVNEIQLANEEEVARYIAGKLLG